MTKLDKALNGLSKKMKALAAIGPGDILVIIELISALVQLLTAAKPLLDALGIGIKDFIAWIKTVWPAMNDKEKTAMIKSIKAKFEKAKSNMALLDK